MSSPPSNSGGGSPAPSPKEANMGDNGGWRAGASASAELLRLQNIIRVKDKELDDARKEIATLKAALHTKERASTQVEQELRLLKERYAVTETEMTNMAKELAGVKVEKKKLEAELSDLVRKGDKEQSMPVLLAQKSLVSCASGEPAFGAQPVLEQVASLKEDLKNARQDGEKAAQNVKVLDNLLRAKDKQIHALKRKLEDVQSYKTKVVALENRISELVKQVEAEKAACRTAGDVARVAEVEKSRLAGDLVKVRSALEAAQEVAARNSAVVKVTEARCTALEQEVSTLVGELARASAVAMRVAVSEVKAGCKDEGVVHVTRHLEEVRYMTGEVMRLQQRVTTLEKELAVSEELKERYRRLSEAGTSARTSDAGGASPLTSPSGAAGGGGRLTYRPGSARPAVPATPRRPATAGGAPATVSSAAARRSSVPGARPSTANGEAAGAAAVRRSTIKKLPWNFNPESPIKLAAAAAAESTASPNSAGKAVRRVSAKARAVAVRKSIQAEGEAVAVAAAAAVATPVKVAAAGGASASTSASAPAPAAAGAGAATDAAAGNS